MPTPLTRHCLLSAFLATLAIISQLSCSGESSTGLQVGAPATGLAQGGYVVGASANQTVTISAPNATPFVIAITRF